MIYSFISPNNYSWQQNLLILYLNHSLMIASVTHAETYSLVTKWGSSDSGDGQFNSLIGVTVDSTGNIYVADHGNHCIQKFDSNGEFITKIEGQLYGPEDIVIDSSGNVYVADFSSQIQKFNTKINPTIIWNSPTEIIYGTLLSSTQLNAAATDPSTGESISGTFTYTLADGTSIDVGAVLNAGTQILRAEFTPDDAVNYNTASMDVTINVLTPVQKIQQMTDTVQSLVNSDLLTNKESYKLISNLNAAINDINDGNMKKVITDLNAFIITINQDVKNGRLSLSQGNSLIDDANSVINAIR